MKRLTRHTIRPYMVLDKIGSEYFKACMDCTDRHPGCHGACEKYLSAKKEYRAKMKSIRDEHRTEYITSDYIIRRATEMQRASTGKTVRTEDALKRRGI